MPGPAVTVVVSLVIVGAVGFVAGRVHAAPRRRDNRPRDREVSPPGPSSPPISSDGEASSDGRDARAGSFERLREPEERARSFRERSAAPEQSETREDDTPSSIRLDESTLILDDTDGTLGPETASRGSRSHSSVASAADRPGADGGPAILQQVPPFDLRCVTGDGESEIRRTREDYRGRWLVLVFYPDDFSFVCPTELQAVSNRLDEFERMNCSVLAVSGDTLEQHVRWIQTPRRRGGVGRLRFPLASDESGAVARAYGVGDRETGIHSRGLFIVDPEGVLQYQALQNSRVGRGTDELLRILAALQTRGLCDGSWGPDSEPMDLVRELRDRKVLSHYELMEELGAGAFGVVYKAKDLILDRTVALKVLVPEKLTSTHSTVAEARAAAALSHPNVCTIYAADDSSGAPLIAMEYIEGETLRQKLGDGALAARRCARIGAQVAGGLAAAHARGIVHGDLKPENIMITPDGAAKILDFGLARTEERGDPEVDGPARDRGGTIRGTPRYMSPEQARGRRVGPSADVFSLTLILVEMLTGEPVVRGETTREVLAGVCQVDAEALAARAPSPFDEVIRRGLVLDPEARDLRMTEIADSLG